MSTDNNNINNNQLTMPAPNDPTNKPIRLEMEELVRRKQKQIVTALETLEPNMKFHIDNWERGNDGGGGTTCVIQNGETFEKGGCNVSAVYGKLTPEAVLAMKNDHKDLHLPIDNKTGLPDSDGVKFFACGLSMVIHPNNPHAPTTHLNYRYFETWNTDGTPMTWWFGGGADLTPSYLYDDDAIFFHENHKNALDKYDTKLYPEWKKWADKYYYIPHRNETRGIGGTFFDDYNEKDPKIMLKLIEDSFDAWLDSYIPIMQKRKDMEFTPKQKEWQAIRRGRYVEFNIMIDRGTQFGLRTPGSRIESILMTLPVHASWMYEYHPDKGSHEEKLIKATTKPRDWVN